MNSNERFDVFKEITRKIVMRLAEGDIPWRKRWCSPVTEKLNYVSRREYSGINLLLLDKPGEYMTFNQCSKAGGKIRKGEKASLVIKWIPFIPKSKKEEAERLQQEGKSTEHLKRFLSGFDKVFHISQTEGLKSKSQCVQHSEARKPTDMADFVVEEYSREKGLRVVETPTDEVTYDPDEGTLTVPSRTQFPTEEQWYNTLFGGMVKAALADLSQTQELEEEQDRRNPAKDELAAEIGAAMVINGVGLEIDETQQDTMAECTRWMKELNRDYRLIVNAASRAEKVARSILSPLIG